MTCAADLVAEALAAGLLLSRRGEQIHVESPHGRPLPEGLRERLGLHRQQLLAWFDWCERADELLLACSRRLAAAYPAGCPLDGEAWRPAERALHDAHRSQNAEQFEQALGAYEAFAQRAFRNYTRRVR